MKVGIINALRNHPSHPYPIKEVYDDYVSDAVLAEKLGFDFSWYGEHHFRPCQWTPSPIVVCAAVAAKTTKLRVGTSVLCLPFHNPLRVAEDVAVADILSGGRFDFGIGVGSQWEEFHTFGILPGEMNGRTWESIEIIERCFGDEKMFSHKGKYYDFPDVAFTTKPVQKPFPIWWGGFGPKNVAKAAQKGYHLLAGGPQYDIELKKAGRDPKDFGVAPMQMVSIAETNQKAWEVAIEGLHYFVNFYVLRKQLDGSMPPASAEVTRDMLRSGKVPPPFGPTVGTPTEVRDRLKGVGSGAFGRATHLPIAFRHAGMRTPDVHKAMELFAKEVLPALK